LHRKDENTSLGSRGLGETFAKLNPQKKSDSHPSPGKSKENSSRLAPDGDNMTTYSDRSKLVEIQGFDSPDSRLEPES
jgi:hypothetical protein